MPQLSTILNLLIIGFWLEVEPEVDIRHIAKAAKPTANNRSS